MNRVYIDKLLEGDLSYFEEFYEETKYKVFYNILSIVKDEVSAEDILQETYLRFLNNLDKLKKEKNILGYLFVISRNISLDYIKKRNKEKLLDELTLSNIKDDEQSDYDDQIYKLAKEILNEKEFQIVILHVVNELTHKEIARLLNRPLGSITWSYNNAIKKLKKGVKNYE